MFRLIVSLCKLRRCTMDFIRRVTRQAAKLAKPKICPAGTACTFIIVARKHNTVTISIAVEAKQLVLWVAILVDGFQG